MRLYLRLLAVSTVTAVLLAACANDAADVSTNPDDSLPADSIPDDSNTDDSVADDSVPDDSTPDGDDGIDSNGDDGSDEPADGEGGLASGPSMPSLAGDWVLERLLVEGAVVAIPDGTTLDMNINRGKISGNGGCNGFGGTIDIVDAATLRIRNLAWTEMACEPFEILDFEQQYLSALSAVSAWTADPKGVTFLTDIAELRYVADAPAVQQPLEKTTWVLDTIFSGDGPDRAASSTNQTLPPATMLIDAGRVTFSADDCDDVSFDLNYEIGREGNLNKPDEADFGPFECATDDSNFRVAMRGVINASGFTIAENRLTLIGPEGELVGFRAELS